MTEKEFVAFMGLLAKADMSKSGVLASVTTAQAILESGYGTTELAMNANNFFGMKCSLSGNTWPGSTWNGQSKYTKNTPEDKGNGEIYYITADFRKYGSAAESVADHSAYLLGAKNGIRNRYEGLKGEMDPKTAITIIKNGGYATDTKYISKILDIIERFDLTKYDKAAEQEGGSNMGINIIKQTGTHGLYTSGRAKELYLVIHYTAGVTSKKGAARGTASWFANPNAGGTADFICDDEEIVQYNPDPGKYSCWAVGGNPYGNKGGKLHGKANNHNCISIEINSNNKTGKPTNANDSNWYFTDAALANAAKLARYLMDKYNIPISRVIRHYDVTGKLCPGIKGWNLESGSGNEDAWKTWKAQLEAEAPDTSPTPAPVPEGTTTNYKYEVTVSDLNIRKGPGTSYDVVGQTGKGVFTIVAEQSGWGKLKSGAGWISLNAAYGHKASGESATAPSAPEALKWTVAIPDLRIRKGPGTDYDWTGSYTGKGTFTIVEQKNGWGRLKSGAGWISLNTAYGHKA